VVGSPSTEIYLSEIIRRMYLSETINKITGIDKFFIEKIRWIVQNEENLTGIEKIIKIATKTLNNEKIMSPIKDMFDNEKSKNGDESANAANIMECFQSMTSAFQSEEKMNLIMEKMGLNLEENPQYMDMFKQVSTVMPLILQFANQTRNGENGNTNQLLQGLFSTFTNSSGTSGASKTSKASETSTNIMNSVTNSEDLQKIFEIVTNTLQSSNQSEDTTEKMIMRISQYLINKNRTKSKKQAQLEEKERLKTMDPDVPLIRYDEYDEMEDFFNQNHPEID